MNTTRETPEEVPLLKAKPRTFRSKRVIYAIIGVVALIICIAVFYSPLSRKQSQSISPWEEHATKKEGDAATGVLRSDDDSSDFGTERVLYTDNPNDYLCDAQFLYELNEELDNYHFTCLYQQGPLECKEGYALKCLASATYGDSAGGCNKEIYDEITEAPYGCGWRYENGAVKCSDDVCAGSHSGEIDECYNLDTGEEALTVSPCLDCVPICRCGNDSPQFYNVADCFGDRTSSNCVGGLSDEEESGLNLYLPQSLWEDYCVGQNSCYFNWKQPQVKECEDNVYYEGVAVNGKESALWSTASGYEVDEVINDFYASCQDMKFKILAVCEKDD